MAICFHVAIELSAEVQVFSFLAIAALVIWAVPSTHDRVLLLDPDSRAQRRFGTVVAGLDWLARFRIEWEPGGGPVTAVDRDGRVLEGRWAVPFVLSRLPVTAWFALPVLLLLGARPRVHARSAT